MMTVKTGPLGKLVDDLLDLAEGWQHLGNLQMAVQCATAAQRLLAGAAKVTAGHCQYEVRG